MIAHVIGEIVEKIGSSLIIDVHGIGYEVHVSAGDFESAELKQAIKLHTYHHIREQNQELFGFSSLVAKRLFEMLITVQGVGPKAALAILSISDVESVRSAIAMGDATYLAKAVGVGKKTAERVVVDLSDKVGEVTVIYKDNGKVQQIQPEDEALEALMALGYNLNDASELLKDIDAELSTAERVMLALKGNR